MKSYRAERCQWTNDDAALRLLLRNQLQSSTQGCTFVFLNILNVKKLNSEDGNRCWSFPVSRRYSLCKVCRSLFFFDLFSLSRGLVCFFFMPPRSCVAWSLAPLTLMRGWCRTCADRRRRACTTNKTSIFKITLYCQLTIRREDRGTSWQRTIHVVRPSYEVLSFLRDSLTPYTFLFFTLFIILSRTAMKPPVDPYMTSYQQPRRKPMMPHSKPEPIIIWFSGGVTCCFL